MEKDLLTMREPKCLAKNFRLVYALVYMSSVVVYDLCA